MHVMRIRDILIGVIMILSFCYLLAITTIYIHTGNYSLNIFHDKRTKYYIVIASIGVVVFIVNEIKGAHKN